MERFKNRYLKHSQKTYSLSFKLTGINKVQSGFISNRAAMLKYGRRIRQ